MPGITGYCPPRKEPSVLDVLFVAVTLLIFGALALLARAVEKR